MASRFQAAAIVASPSYPNAIAWSDDNLIAVASSHLVTILNPALPFGPRGLITIPTTESYPIGRVKKEDLFSDCLLPTALSRDLRPCVRSISWSPIGMAPNYGCLLAVCSIDGHVRVYRPPFCDFCSEWIEVIDITDRLYQHLASNNFRDVDIPSAEFAPEQATLQGCSHDFPGSCTNDLPDSFTRKECKRKRLNATSYSYKDLESNENQSPDYRNGEKTRARSGTPSKMEENRLPKVRESKSEKKKRDMLDNCAFPMITAEQYAFRSAMLSSIVVAWSPMLCLSSETSLVPQIDSSSRFSIFAAGGKSGKVSFWRIHAQQCYSIEHGGVPNCVTFVGLICAHSSWVNAISFTLLGSGSGLQVFMASGSSDGSVRIWLAKGDDLLESSETKNAPFVLMKEVISVNVIPVTVLSLGIPVQSQHNLLLAVGKGSGSLEVWTCDVSRCQFDKDGSYNAHDTVVTGLVWAFGGCCLYSCSQDNYVRCWVLRGSSLCEVSIPSNTPGLRSSTDLPDVFLSCLGVALSPGNLVVAMVRNLDIDQLDHMYQARAQKAIVEFFWNGGLQLDMLSNSSPDFGDETFPGFSANELTYWEANILQSLKKYENVDEPLVVWDIVAALLAFKQSIPNYVDRIMVKWLSQAYLGSCMDLSIDEVLACIPESFSNMTTRKLHLLNIICRRVVISELKANEDIHAENLGGPTDAEGEPHSLWMELLHNSEKELRKRLVAFNFSAFLSHKSESGKILSQPEYWCPVGMAQMKQWVSLNQHVKGQLKVLMLEVGKHERRLHLSEYGTEEQCSYCSASVPFTSPEVAFCKGLENHKLARCAVSMQVCPTTPLWFCKCCRRWAATLAPEAVFRMERYPQELKSLTKDSIREDFPEPFCLFCGILLQRSQPDFLLSPSPV